MTKTIAELTLEDVLFVSSGRVGIRTPIKENLRTPRCNAELAPKIMMNNAQAAEVLRVIKANEDKAEVQGSIVNFVRKEIPGKKGSIKLTYYLSTIPGVELVPSATKVPEAPKTMELTDISQEESEASTEPEMASTKGDFSDLPEDLATALAFAQSEVEAELASNSVL